MARILKQQTLYREIRFHAAFPSIASFSDGELVLAFRRARDGMWLVPEHKREGFDTFARMDHIDSRSHIALMTLDAAGEPGDAALELLPFNPEASDQDPSLLVLPGDRLLLGSFSYYPLPSELDELMRRRSGSEEPQAGCRYLSWGSHVSLRGRQRGDWRYHHRYLEPDGDYGSQLGVEDRQPTVGALRGRMLYHDGTILLPLYYGTQQGSALFASDDDGAEWHFRGLIARDPDASIAFQEPALCAAVDGGIVCFMRTSGAQGRLASCGSADGVEWSAPRLHELVGHPFHPLPLDDGRVLLSYGYREPPYGIRARLLDGPRSNPDLAEEIIVRDDGLCRDIGYPWGVQLQDGRVMLVYYWTDAKGMRGIEASWLEI